MKLKSYLNAERGEASRIAILLNISMSYLSQMASGKASISPQRCVEIESVTNGAVTRKDLRPSDWHLIWPELDK